MEKQVSVASRTDAQGIKVLLAAAGLPCDDIEGHISDFIVIRMKEELIGAVAVELHGNVGLLRSLCVREDHRGRGLARLLCEEAENYARRSGVMCLYLLTLAAEGFFVKMKFEPMNRSAAPAEIRQTRQFRDVWFSDCILMGKMTSS